MVKDYRYILGLAARLHPARPILEFLYLVSVLFYRGQQCQDL